MKDRFRKFVREEKEWKKLNPQDAETSKQSASKPVGSLQDMFWGPIKENPKATNSECTAKSYETSKVSQYGTSKDQQSKSEEIEKGKDNRNQNTT
ncbi:hypothetical protein TELCIR_16075 [Teladorsagia circumcincta]|uniref:Uncharacterized protein n=1 Tax=Teladorsagia circumcincta TaxID=45464 RepID=A0A2G9TYR7_TELCI|nr:hypothetical protein TELCIR_16075 [Teladorsagia circumcincta]